MLRSTWVQFSWNLLTLPTTTPPLDSRYHIEAPTIEHSADLDACISRAYSMEPIWAHDLSQRVHLAQQILVGAFPEGDISFVAIKHGGRIIAAAALCEATEEPSHLPLGVCVLQEYRNRGLGTSLLYEVLRRLRDRGLEHARLVTKKSTSAERYLYPKFGSVRVILEANPTL